jgi:hypothetical protein
VNCYRHKIVAKDYKSNLTCIVEPLIHSVIIRAKLDELVRVWWDVAAKTGRGSIKATSLGLLTATKRLTKTLSTPDMIWYIKGY